MNPIYRLPLALLLGAGFCSGAVSQEPRDTEIAALKEEIATLKGMLPSQSHTMIDVEYHFANLWFAGKAGNWPLATFYLDETRSHLHWAVRVRSVRKLAGGGEIDLRPMLKAIEQSALANLKTAVDKKDDTAFDGAYKQMLAQCQSCHQAAEKPYLKLEIPLTPASRLVQTTQH